MKVGDLVVRNMRGLILKDMKGVILSIRQGEKDQNEKGETYYKIAWFGIDEISDMWQTHEFCLFQKDLPDNTHPYGLNSGTGVFVGYEEHLYRHSKKV